MSKKKSWGPGRVIFWMIVGGLLGIIAAGLLESQLLLTISGGVTGVGFLLGAIRLMFK